MATSELETLIRLFRCGKRVAAAVDRRLTDEDITLAQWEAVLYLTESDSIRQQELADRIGINRASLVVLLNRLERDGWVKRKPNPQDQRSHLVALTEQGRKKIPRIEAVMRTVTKGLTRGLSQSEVAGLSDLLDRVFMNLEEEES